MTTATIILRDFLLARIAEDEAQSSDWHSTDCGINADPVYPCDCGHPAQVLARCKADRRIVEAARHAGEVEGGGAALIMFDGYPREGIPSVLAALASVYADHDDYREEWAV